MKKFSVCVCESLVHYDSSGLIYVLELLVFPNSLKMQSKWKLQQEACTIYHDGEKISQLERETERESGGLFSRL